MAMYCFICVLLWWDLVAETLQFASVVGCCRRSCFSDFKNTN